MITIFTEFISKEHSKMLIEFVSLLLKKKGHVNFVILREDIDQKKELDCLCANKRMKD